MEPIIVETSTGQKVYLKSFITYGDEVTVERYRDEMIQYDPQTRKPLPITVAVLKAASQKAFELLLIKVENPDGTLEADPMKAVYAMSPDDGKKIKAKADEIYSQAKLTKKNENSSA